MELVLTQYHSSITQSPSVDRNESGDGDTTHPKPLANLGSLWLRDGGF